jgi:hypothetical protein
MNNKRMNSSASMTSVAVAGGQVTITDETVEIDIGPFGALKRVYEQSRLVVALFIICLLIAVGMFLSDSSPFRELGLFAIVFTVVGLALSSILGKIAPKISNNIKFASSINRTTIDHIEYTVGSRLRLPKLYIIVTDGEVTGTRSVPLSLRKLGGDQQLEHAIQSFEEAGISVTSTDDTTIDD